MLSFSQRSYAFEACKMTRETLLTWKPRRTKGPLWPPSLSPWWETTAPGSTIASPSPPPRNLLPTQSDHRLGKAPQRTAWCPHSLSGRFAAALARAEAPNPGQGRLKRCGRARGEAWSFQEPSRLPFQAGPSPSWSHGSPPPQGPSGHAGHTVTGRAVVRAGLERFSVPVRTAQGQGKHTCRRRGPLGLCFGGQFLALSTFTRGGLLSPGKEIEGLFSPPPLSCPDGESPAMRRPAAAEESQPLHFRGKRGSGCLLPSKHAWDRGGSPWHFSGPKPA